MKGVYSYAVGIATILNLLTSNTVKCEISRELVIRQQNSSSITLEDGEQIALEVSNTLLPPKELSEKISQELKMIKFKYRIVSKITHQRKWIPGQLISTRITPEQIRHVNQSEFGPLEDVQTIDLLPFYIVSILSFSKPYNPIVLGEMLSFHYGFSSSPNTVYFDGNDIYYDESNSTYIFKKGPDECMLDVEVCQDKDKKHFWEFFVSDSGIARLVKEYDIDAEGKKFINRRYLLGNQ